MTERVVLFVCPHGAAKSRMAAAWFNSMPVSGWSATSAGVAPQPAPSVHPARLLAGTAALQVLEHGPPRPVADVARADLVVAIDCDPPPDKAVPWRLTHQNFDAAMCAEIRDRVDALSSSLKPQEQP
jgi:protein-tyrosine-phosphatase